MLKGHEPRGYIGLHLNLTQLGSVSIWENNLQPFKTVHIENNEQNTHVPVYIPH